MVIFHINNFFLSKLLNHDPFKIQIKELNFVLTRFQSHLKDFSLQVYALYYDLFQVISIN